MPPGDNFGVAGKKPVHRFVSGRRHTELPFFSSVGKCSCWIPNAYRMWSCVFRSLSSQPAMPTPA